MGSVSSSSLPSATRRLASPRLWDATACWRETLTTIATALTPTRAAANAARRSRRRRRARSVMARAKDSSTRGQLPRVPLAPQRVLAEGRARPQEVRRAALLVPEVRGLLELVAQQRALRVLRLPAHEPQPRPQQRLVDDLDPVTAGCGSRCHAFARALRERHLPGRQQPRGDQLPQHLLGRLAVREDRQQLLPVARRPRPLRRHEVAEDLPHHPLPLGPDPLERRLRVARERAGHAADLRVGLLGEELPLPVPLLPQARHGEGEQRQRPALPLDRGRHLADQSPSSKR